MREPSIFDDPGLRFYRWMVYFAALLFFSAVAIRG